MTTSLWAMGAVVVASCFGAIGSLFLKKFAAQARASIWTLLNWNFVIGAGFYGLGTVFFILAVPHGEISALYPVAASQFIWVNVISKYYFKEPMNALKWIGVALIVVGVTFIGLGS